MNTASSEHTTSTAGQSLHRDCLGSYHVMCVHFPGETAEYFPLPTGVDGMTLQAARVNRFNGQIVRPTAYTSSADTTLHLFASSWPGLFYVCEYLAYRQRFKCSCGEALCEHIKQLRGLISR